MKHLLLAVTMLITLAVSAQTTPCKGKTKSGRACTAIIVSKETGYCNVHNPNRAKCSALNTRGEHCGVAPLKGTTLCRIHTGKGK